MAYTPSYNLRIDTGVYAPSNDLVISDGQVPPVSTVLLINSYSVKSGQGKPLNQSNKIAWLSSPGNKSNIKIGHQNAKPMEFYFSIPWDRLNKLNSSLQIKYDAFVPNNISVAICWRQMLPIDKNIKIVYGRAVAENFNIKTPWREINPLDINQSILYGGGTPKDINYYLSNNSLTAKDINLSVPWGVGIKPVNVYEYFPPIVIIPVPPPPVEPPVTLGSFNAYREDTGESVELLSCSMNLDKDSWAWSLTASVADKASLDIIKPSVSGVVELHIEISGYHWIFIIQSYSDNKQFNERQGLIHQFQIQGLSKTAYLGHPFAARQDYEQTSDFTANQLINNELQFTGFSATFSITDWLVNAGAYSYTQKSAIESIAQIAAAPGALIIPDRLNDEFEIKYDYPESYWNWSSISGLDEITDDEILTLSGKYLPNVLYNGVYVTGQNIGVSAWIRKTGTAGDILHPTITDQLITDVIPARERGRNIISGSGNKMEYALDMLFLDSSILFEISQIVKVNEAGELFYAKVEAISIEVSIKKDMAVAFQKLDIIRHIT